MVFEAPVPAVDAPARASTAPRCCEAAWHPLDDLPPLTAPTARLLGHYGIGPLADAGSDRRGPRDRRAPDGVCAVVLAAGEGTRLRPLTELRAQGAVPGRQRAAARPGAGPAGRARPAGPAGSRSTPATWPSRSSRTSATGRTCRSSRATRWAPPAALASLRDWIDGRARAGRQRRRLPRRPGRAARPGHRRPAGRLGRRDRTPARRAGRRPAAGRVRRPPVRRVLAAALAGGRATCRSSAATWSARCGGRPRRPARLEVVEYRGHYLDTGTPADYLAANLHAAGRRQPGRRRRARSPAGRSGRWSAPARVVARRGHRGGGLAGRRTSAAGEHLRRRDPGRPRPDRHRADR